MTSIIKGIGTRSLEGADSSGTLSFYCISMLCKNISPIIIEDIGLDYANKLYRASYKNKGDFNKILAYTLHSKYSNEIHNL